MRVGVISVAAIRISGIAVALDDAGVGGRALESLWTSGETLSCTCSDVVRKTGAVVGVTHEDGSLDSVESIAGKCRSRTTAESVVHNLATLRVSNKNNLCAWALLVVRCHGLDNGLGSLRGRAIVAGATTGGLSTTSWVVDGF